MNLLAIADSTIPAANNKRVLKYKSGETRDIVKEVLECYQENKEQLQKFAPYLKGATTLETCSNIWNFWKQNIRYQVDDDGIQWIKTPAAVWATKFCDCKSFSVAVASTLYCLGIDGKFRFASYGSNSILPTHVYVVATPKAGKEIIIDCVWTGFNSQKPFAKNWDYNMTQIFRVSGFQQESITGYKPGELNIDVNDPNVSEAQLELALQKQTLEMEQMINRRKVSGIGAIGSPLDNAYQVEIEAYTAALQAISGTQAIGLFRSKKKKLAIAIKKNDGKGVNKKQQKLLAKAGIAVKKKRDGLLKRIGKGIVKVIATPLRLAVKSQLPKNAPFFLYLFITDPKILAKLPEAVATKRGKAITYKKVLVDKLQMKESNFTSTVRNGIMNHFGKSPEDVIAEWIKNANYQVGIITEVLSFAGKGLKALLTKLGANISDDLENSSPAPEDWGADALLTPEERTAKANAMQNSSPQAVYSSGGGTYSSSTGTFNENSMSDGDTEGTQVTDPATTNTWTKMDTGQWQNDQTGEIRPTKPFNAVETLPGVSVTNDKNLNLPAAESGGTGMLLFGLAGLALLASAGGNSRKKKA